MDHSTNVLIDGTFIKDPLIEFGVGVSDVETIKLRLLDEDNFGEVPVHLGRKMTECARAV